MQPAEFDGLMAELGPLDDAVVNVVRDEDTRWIVRVDDVDVSLDLEPESGVVRLSTEIGVPAQSKRGMLYEQLLVYNMAGQGTGDVVMALSAPGGTVIQLLNLQTAGLTAGALVVPVVNLAVRTPLWRSIVCRGIDSDLGVEPATEPFSDSYILA